MLKVKMLGSSIIIVIIIIIFLYLYNQIKKKDLFVVNIERKLGPVDIFYLNNPTNTTITPNPTTNIYHKLKQEDCVGEGSAKKCTYTIVEPQN